MTSETPVEKFEVDQRLTAQSTYYAGKVASIFFTTLRDQKKILGIRCTKCSKILWPPRSTCGRCFSTLSESDLVEIGPNGTLLTYTRVEKSDVIHPRKAPFIYGIILLDGADTGITHFIDEVDFKELHTGMRMQAVFSTEPRADIQMIDYFKPE